jgi:predicted ABC-type ATPase
VTAKRVIIIAGPNGAGKTTFARTFLMREGECPAFINADLLAAGLDPLQPELAAIRAGKLMLQEVDRHIDAGNSFAFETTLSGRSWIRHFHKWKQLGYFIELIYLMLDSLRIARSRVKARVRQGGHDIPDDVIERRFEQGWENFNNLYRPIVDHWELYNNSGGEPLLIHSSKKTSETDDHH